MLLKLSQIANAKKTREWAVSFLIALGVLAVVAGVIILFAIWHDTMLVAFVLFLVFIVTGGIHEMRYGDKDGW